MRFPFLPLAIILLSSSFSVQAKMYKWVDEEGQIHFGDKIPAKYLAKEHDELNEKGMMSKHQMAVKTAAEKAEERRLENERKKIALEEKKKKQLDRELLDIYSTERDLIIARDTRLDAIAAQIQQSKTFISDSNKKIESMEKQVAQIKTSNREVPADLYNRIEDVRQQVASQGKVIDSHKKRSDEISEKYNGYIERFRAAKQR